MQASIEQAAGEAGSDGLGALLRVSLNDNGSLQQAAVQTALGGSSSFIGTASGVDDTATIQALLTAGGTVTGTKGQSYIISSSLVISSNSTLDLTGCTITLKAGSNCNMIHNAAWVAGSGRDSNIEIRGGTWARGANAGSGQGLHSILLQRVDQLYIHDLRVTSSGGKYMICPYACTDFVVARIYGNCASAIVQLDGACSGFKILDIYGTTGDDSVAMTPVDWTAYQNGDYGDITDGLIDGVYTTSTTDGVAIYGGTFSATPYHCKRITVRNVMGAFTATGVVMGGNAGQAATQGGNLYDITVDNVVNTAGTGHGVRIISMGGGTAYNLVLSRIGFRDVTNMETISVEATASSATTVESLTVRDCYWTGGTNATGAILISDNASGSAVQVNHLLLDNIEIANTTGVYGVVLSGTSPTVQTIHAVGCRINGAGSGGLVRVLTTTSTPTLTNVIVTGLDAKATTHAVGDFGAGVSTNLYLDGISSGSITDLVNNRSGTTLTIWQATGLSGSNVRKLGSTGTITNGHLLGGGAKASVTYSASITPDCTAGTWQNITVSNGTAFTINAPINTPDSSSTGELLINIFNNSGGAMGAITWNAAFVFAGDVWANPASTKNRIARFEWNGAAWICVKLSAGDY